MFGRSQHRDRYSLAPEAAQQAKPHVRSAEYGASASRLFIPSPIPFSLANRECDAETAEEYSQQYENVLGSTHRCSHEYGERTVVPHMASPEGVD